MSVKPLKSLLEWPEPEPDWLIERWPGEDSDLRKAQKLVIGPGQGCVVVNNGRLEVVCSEEGAFPLADKTPFWAGLVKVFAQKPEETRLAVWFYHRTQISGQKFGTPAPVKYVDPVYKIPVGLRAFGNFSFRIGDIAALLRQAVGQQDLYHVEEARKLIVGRLVQPLAEVLAASQFSWAEIDAHRAEISSAVQARLAADVAGFGLELVDFRLDGTSFDEDTTRRIGRVSDLQAEAQAAAAVGLDYAGLAQVEAAKNRPAATAPHPGAGDPLEALAKLKKMREMDLITAEEFEVKKKDILARM